MYIRKIAGFILITIVLSTTNCFAQDTAQWTRGLRFGCDLSRFLVHEFQSERNAMEFSFDTEYKSNKFATLEIGLEKATKENNRISYKSDGYYGRLGIDFNILKKDKLEKGRDVVFVGFRYGYYRVNQQVNSFMNPGFYPSDTLRGSYSSKSLYGHWAEVAFGLKVEVLKNLFLGASIRGKFMLYAKKDINYPYYMPGFGNGANNANFGINYSVYYQIPLMKVTPKKPLKKDVKPEAKKAK
jgi:hypothetical protein